VDVLPEFAVQQKRQSGQDHKKYQNENAKSVALQPNRHAKVIGKLSDIETRSVNLVRIVCTNDFVCFQEQKPFIARNPNGINHRGQPYREVPLPPVNAFTTQSRYLFYLRDLIHSALFYLATRTQSLIGLATHVFSK
jgi:hypothetical protein